jgi:hypothetical protein
MSDNATAPPTLREKLAALCHEQWRAWMNSLASCTPAETHLWQQQLWLAYADLTEAMKESARAAADKFIGLFMAELTESDGGKREFFELMAATVADYERNQQCGGVLDFKCGLKDAILAWRDAEMTACTARLRAEEVLAEATLEASRPDFAPDGAKLTNEAARRAWATKTCVDEVMEADVLEARAQALRYWVEALVGPAGQPRLIHEVPEEPR